MQGKVKTDPIEKTVRYSLIKKQLEMDIEDYAKKHFIFIHGFGSCHKYWEIKQKILKENIISIGRVQLN